MGTSVTIIVEYSCVVLCCIVLFCVGRELRAMSGDKAKVEKYSSLGLDGAMVVWEFKVDKQNFYLSMYRMIDN